MLERQIEKYFCERVAAAGGIAEKVVSLSARGFFDRLVLLPGGRILFVELKRPKRGVWAQHQRDRHRQYAALGAEVYLVKTYADIDAMFDPASLAGVQNTVTNSVR